MTNAELLQELETRFPILSGDSYTGSVMQALADWHSEVAKAARSEANVFTVIGLESDGVIWTYEATPENDGDAYEAMLMAADAHEYGDTEILGAIRGKHAITCACDDSGKAATVDDLIEAWTEDSEDA